MEKQVIKLPVKPSLQQLIKVAAYARVSSGKDAMLRSLAAQVSYYSDLIQKHPGWRYAGVYADEAMTGTKDNREEFQQLLADCRAGKIDMIITKSVSRFARNTVTSLETVRELKAIGVDVYFEEQKIHSMDERFRKADAKLNRLKAERQDRLMRVCSVKKYVENLRGQAGPIEVWNEQAWCLLVTQVTVHADGSAEFLFRGENRITVK